MHPRDGGTLSQIATGMACYTCAITTQFLVALIEHHRLGILNYLLLFGARRPCPIPPTKLGHAS